MRIEREEKDLCSYLLFLRPNALLLYAGILRRSGQPAKADAQVRRVTKAERLNARVQYNLACYHSEAGEYDEALEHLGQALRMAASGELGRWAREDPSLERLKDARATQFRQIGAR